MMDGVWNYDEILYDTSESTEVTRIYFQMTIGILVGDSSPTYNLFRSVGIPQIDGVFRQDMTYAFQHSAIPDTQPFNLYPYYGQTIMALPDPTNGMRPLTRETGMRIRHPRFGIGVMIGIRVDTDSEPMTPINL